MARNQNAQVTQEQFDQAAFDNWKPKTALGKAVKDGTITSLDEIFEQGKVILEPEIVEHFMTEIKAELLLIGQSKGKFGGGQRRVFRQTQKKTKEGNKPKFATMAIIGNMNGYIGIGFGKARETVPAREKAIRNAKLNVFKVLRGSGSWESQTDEPHSIPFAVQGKCGSVEIMLIPAPKGKGLVAEKEVAKILAFAGIKDVWSKTKGQTKNKINLIKATEQALRRLSQTKVHSDYKKAITGFQEPLPPTKEEGIIKEAEENA